MGDLSTHFSRKEFVSRDGSFRAPPGALLGRLEALRCRVGRPLPILSGYRSPADNRRVGGAVDSRHLHGDAVDLPQGLATVDQAVACGFSGIGRRGNWAVHVDTRPGPLVIWSY